jgi:hypothetical protein
VKCRLVFAHSISLPSVSSTMSFMTLTCCTYTMTVRRTFPCDRTWDRYGSAHDGYARPRLRGEQHQNSPLKPGRQDRLCSLTTLRNRVRHRLAAPIPHHKSTVLMTRINQLNLGQDGLLASLFLFCFACRYRCL